ncbi:MAG: M24 family metallopeptidase [Deltaproteobacteria bacterium]|nr:M24 family metallopeptidase [Deltaproteobacteria bacterium]
MVAAVAPSSLAQSSFDRGSRLEQVRARMKAVAVDVLVVRSTDRFLNEYVPDEESTRLWLTGFSGSMGDAVVTADALHLIVDGRYTLQAAREVPEAKVTTTNTGQSIEGGWLDLLASIAVGKKVGIESDRVSAALWKSIEARATKAGFTAVPLASSPVQEARESTTSSSPVLGGPRGAGATGDDDKIETTTTASFWAIDPQLSGRSVSERVALGQPLLDEHRLDGLLITALDELAWLTNLRGDHFAYQATFRAQGLVQRERVVVAADTSTLKQQRAPEAAVAFVADAKLFDGLAAGARIGVDPSTTPFALCLALAARGCVLVEVASPYALLRTKKTAAELKHMAAAFAKADAVVDNVQRWLAQQLGKNRPVSEADVADTTARLFQESGAFGLSFKVISAVGKNGAIIHYSTPDKSRRVKKGELFLLDTGAYYDGGYATDLTRTFLAGPSTTKATKEQKRLYTIVLQAAIAGMSARVPVGVTGEQIDAIVRNSLWRHGLDYGHGTGHGVGVNVHESPPSIRIGSRISVEPGQVFSIEPGVYLPDWGGVRIENLCTVVDDPVTPPAGVPRRFLRVKPLTFSPLDRRLIERRMLTDHEKRFLNWFSRGNSKLLPPTA